MTQDELKKQVAQAALHYLKNVPIIGMGTGSTVTHLINLLADCDFKRDIEGAVSSSAKTTEHLQSIGIRVIDLNQSGDLDIYVDGADEVTPHKKMLKGGGGALTREKIIAGASKKFVCIVDESKCVDVMGKFPLPVEVLPLSRSFVARQLAKLGGQPELRMNKDTGASYITDNGCEILDVHNLSILDPIELEKTINNIPGVITNGLFAIRDADVVLVGKGSEVITY
ncbi:MULTISPECIES: ribose-5-phosphate isomerase RpiA [Methylomonas]|uniref:Ribose-5-phosphate isomerase A n=2 Tax=Methylomonas TaxID=416 RepID=A0ABU4UDW9_9GAMM|nr:MULTISPECIES: ribose-5-phosphate isomerase RpiA [Methylomonas]MBD9362797.1 ribose-5-phosphate isomerase RpiA [Methylomonas fluvii]MDX8127539.1 ribose-5-phosphate isomerase RpiA [Methylomonas sp. OY6]CAD6875949.1 Ribose 5-phosphate isomerase A (EC 5.3.1.6) [Methylomonas fluvii]